MLVLPSLQIQLQFSDNQLYANFCHTHAAPRHENWKGNNRYILVLCWDRYSLRWWQNLRRIPSTKTAIIVGYTGVPTVALLGLASVLFKPPPYPHSSAWQRCRYRLYRHLFLRFEFISRLASSSHLFWFIIIFFFSDSLLSIAWWKVSECLTLN